MPRLKRRVLCRDDARKGKPAGKGEDKRSYDKEKGVLDSLPCGESGFHSRELPQRRPNLHAQVVSPFQCGLVNRVAVLL